MLRIVFTAADLGRTRVAAAPDPLWETILSVHRLRARDGSVLFGHWREEVRGRLRRASDLLRPLLSLVPQHGYFPDFLTPLAGEHGLTAGIEAVSRTPAPRLRTELALLSAQHRLPSWTASLAEGDPDPLRRLTDALSAYHELAIAPYQSRLTAQIEADRALRARAVLDGGSEGLLSGLRPMMRWRSPVLEVDYPTDQVLHLDGRGLLLVPSFFCWQYPVTLQDPGLPPVLVYPVRKDLGWFTATAGPALAALIGATRASVLAEIGAGRTTSELARALTISPASASQHVGVLRAAGLVLSRRDGPSVLHVLTPLGVSLLGNRAFAP